MEKMEKKWLVKSPIDKEKVEEFRSELKVDTVLSELLLQRGISDFDAAEKFFRPKLEDLHDPFLMKDMDKAVDSLIQALENKENILFFGDYDVDGTCSVALMLQFFKKHQPASVDFYIPDRYAEGYGLSKKGIDYAVEQNVQLLITLDCGIKSVELIDYARKKGIAVIVCDHHTPGEKLPDCIILDPKRKDCNYPYKELCGCGVGFKLLHGLSIKKEWKLEPLYELLDILAVAIGADIVPVTGENRILCHHGMRLLNELRRTAFHELMKLAKRSFPMTLTDVVFTIAPRINAAGRLKHGSLAVELMLEENEQKIREIANEIEQHNSNRKTLDQSITEEAIEKIPKENTAKKSTVVYDENWHKGVIGIVASRLIENFYRPTVVLTKSNGNVTGSARSVGNFNIHEALVNCAHLLENYGGHKFAAGLTLEESKLEEFKEVFEKTVAEQISPKDLLPEQKIDIELNFDTIFTRNENRMKVPKFKRILKQLEPHGPGNMKPVFLSKNVYSKSVRILKEKHLKLQLTQANSDVVIDAIGFNFAEKQDEVALGVPFELVYTLETNIWNGRETLQLNIKDIRAQV